MPKDVVIAGSAEPAKRSAFDGMLAKGSKPVNYGTDAEAAELDKNSLPALKALAEELLQYMAEVGRLGKLMQAAVANLADVQERRLPDLMEANNLPKFDFKDPRTGQLFTIKFDSGKWRVSMPPLKDDQGNTIPGNAERRKAVMAWLREVGSGASIKKNIELVAGLKTDEWCAEAMQQLQEIFPGIDVGLTEKIEPATLTALVNAMLKAGKTVSEDLQIKPVRMVKVNKK